MRFPLPRRVRFSAADRKADKLAEILRRAAIKHRGNQPRVFYPLREVACRFQLPLSLVAAVYRQLEAEGLLTRLRGSKTILNARQSGRRLFVHRIIAMPVPLCAFLTRRKFPLFLMQLQRELRAREFATAAIFYDKGEAQPHALAKRIHHCNADTAIWYMPDQCARQTSLMLRDWGIATVGVCDGGIPGMVCRYEVNRADALRSVVRNWIKQSGVITTTVLRMHERSAADEERIAEVVHREGLNCTVMILADGEVQRSLAPLLDSKRTGYVVTHSAASLLSFRAPHTFATLMALQPAGGAV